MSKEVVYAGDIVPSKSIIGTLDGSEMFCIATPYFQVDGIKKVDLKSFLEIQKKGDSKFGVMLNQVDLYVKTMQSRPFTNRFSIGWTKGRGIKKGYYFMKLYETDTIRDKFKHKLVVAPDGAADENDPKLCTFDYQMTMIMDILLLSKILSINLSTYKDLKDNSKFFDKFEVDVNASINKLLGKGQQLSKEEEFKVAKAYAESFVNTPTFMSRDKKYFAIAQLGKPKTVIETIWSKFYDIFSSTDLESKLNSWKQVIAANSNAIPAFRFIDIVNKTTQAHERRFDGRLTVIQQMSESDKGYNSRIPDFLLTQRCLGPKKFEYMTPNNLPTLWGSTNENPKLTTGASQSGCIFMIPQLEFKYYKSGNPTIEWRAEQLAIKKTSAGSGSAGYDDAAAFVDDEDEEQGGGEQAAQFNDADEIPI